MKPSRSLEKAIFIRVTSSQWVQDKQREKSSFHWNDRGAKQECDVQVLHCSISTGWMHKQSATKVSASFLRIKPPPANNDLKHAGPTLPSSKKPVASVEFNSMNTDLKVALLVVSFIVALKNMSVLFNYVSKLQSYTQGHAARFKHKLPQNTLHYVVRTQTWETM